MRRLGLQTSPRAAGREEKTEGARQENVSQRYRLVYSINADSQPEETGHLNVKEVIEATNLHSFNSSPLGSSALAGNIMDLRD